MSNNSFLALEPGPDGGATLRLRGTVGTRETLDLHALAGEVATHPGAVLVDCQEVEHLGVAALQTLLIVKACRERDGRALHLVRLPARVEELLAVAGLTSLTTGGAS